ncbi:MAG: hypothetical protein WCR49_00850 [Opitutae bacterium]
MDRRDALLVVLLVGVMSALLLPLVSIGVDPHHDGAMLKPALDVLSGQFLFRDSFTQYGAVTCYLQALTLAFQRSLLTLRYSTLGIYAVTLTCLYASWRFLLPRSLTVVACVLFILLNPAYETDPWNHEHWLVQPWSSAYAMMFQAIGLYALFRVIRGEQPNRWGLVLGLACAAVFWCRQPVGIMMTAALITIWPALHWTGWTPAQSSKSAILGRILVGYFAFHAVLFGGYALNGALSAWWYQNIAWPARWSQGIIWGDTLPLVAHPFAAAALAGLGLALALPGWWRRFWPNGPASWIWVYYIGLEVLLLWQHERLLQVIAIRLGGWSILIPLVVLGLALGSFVTAARRRGASLPLEYYLSAALAVLGLGSLVQYYPVADAWHFFYALAPVCGLFIFAVWRWSGQSSPVVAVLFAAVLLPAVWIKAQSIPLALNRPLVTLAGPAVLRGMRVSPEQARSLEQIAGVLALIERYQPGLPGALIGNDALYLCFLRNQANPTPYYVTWRGLADPADNRQRWDYIHRTRPLMILQKARWEAVNEFYQRERYVPLLFVPAEELEIAVPRELADKMGLAAYGIFGIGRPQVRL